MLFDQLITTPGGSASNSLCSLDEANAYIAAGFFDKTAWNAMTDAEKIACLILGGINFNNFVWLGYPCYENQAMCWPRWLKQVERELIHSVMGPYNYDGASEYEKPYQVTDTKDYTADTVLFPEEMKCAQAWFSYDVMYRAVQNRTSPAAGPASDALKSYSLFGDLSLSFSPDLEIPMRDITNISNLLRSRSPETWTLIAPYVSEMYFGGADWVGRPPKPLGEVKPTE